jgi:ribonuclease PH
MGCWHFLFIYFAFGVENCSVGVEYTCWFFLGDTKVLAAVYGPKAGTKKNENPEKACIEVIWKPKTGQIG